MAAREGWENRRGGRMEDDMDRGGRRGGNQGGGRREEHDHGGWFGDSQEHASAAREGWENRRREEEGRGNRGGNR